MSINGILKNIAIVAAIFTLLGEGASAFLNTQEAVKLKAAADNAALRQHGEAIQAEQQAQTQLEAARNASLRLKSEADTITHEVQINRSKAVSEMEAARVAARKFKAETEALEANNRTREKFQNELLDDLRLLRCPGKTSYQKLSAHEEGKC
jgi:hypothetical protein